ncbi:MULTISPECIES: hypothetical protein [unclassified Streptomyces]|uniref:hypothetical protein n=1 Tax=unclassified Streptomyces TaxID=2593676 RepID=UPI000DC76A47|nr:MULTISPECIES: hypothetical protein [unclassified Streptomyces]AWZ06342.1 hypothetical protein DRB89_18850 [Streptomyces sp. ICC4]AWZ18179.1 hypothetical protein DRB96_22785 [Streptomyces sp. ICC1]
MTHSQQSREPQVPPPPGPFMTVRTALILLSSAVLGATTGGLAVLAGGGPAAGALAGLAAAGACVSALHSLLQ